MGDRLISMNQTLFIFGEKRIPFGKASSISHFQCVLRIIFCYYMTQFLGLKKESYI